MNRFVLMAAAAMLATIGATGAAHAQSRTGTVRAIDGNNQDDPDVRSRRVSLPWGPPPGTGHGNPSNPAYYAVCGIQRVAGYFDKYSSVRMGVDSSGFYEMIATEGYSRTQGMSGVEGAYECMPLSDLGDATDLAAALGAPTSYAQSPVVSATTTVANTTTSPARLCPWFGVSGAFSEYDTSAYAFTPVGSAARFATGPQTKMMAVSTSHLGDISTEAFCVDYANHTASWDYQWIPSSVSLNTYDAPSTYTGGWTGVTSSAMFCYLEGVSRDIPTSSSGYPSAGNIDVSLYAQTGTGHSSPEYRRTENGAVGFWNCVSRFL